jgi:TolB-like protein/DNA-binding SARP family transcriptional activator/Tfp pilus assembly protein PilF
MSDVEIQLLGPLNVTVRGEARALPKSRKTRALLAMLALEPGEHSRSVLCDWIWPDTADPRAALRWSLTRLREILVDDAGPLISSSRESVGLDWSRVDTDQRRLVHLLQSLEDADLDTLITCERQFDRAPLAGLEVGMSAEFQLWLESQRESMMRLHQELLGVLIDRTQGRQPEAALEFARNQVTVDPLNVAANIRLLGIGFALQGRSEAQEALERMRARFREAGLPDRELLAAWRDLAGSGADERIELVRDDLAETVRELPRKPSVAVLNFEDLGGHESGAVLAEGIALDLNSRLAQLRGLFVIARASAARFSLASEDASLIGQRLGVRYLVHGTTRRTTDRLRVSINLIEAEHGVEIWSDHFDRPLGDLFEVQDDIADRVASALEPQIEQAEMDRARLLPTESLDAWECFHRAMWHSFRFTVDDNRSAHALFQRAASQDPHFARAYAGLSFNHFSRAFLDASPDVPGEIRQALEHAEQAVSLDGRDAMGYWALGRAQLLNREHDRAMSAIDRALVANPNYAQGHYARGFIGVHTHLPELAVSDLDMAQRLSPFDPMLFAIKSSRGISLMVQGRLDEAATWAVQATLEPNAHFHIYANAAACLELVGRSDEARRNLRQALARHPGYDVATFERSFPHKLPRHQALISDALRRAGLN